jgi:tetratricopeptide (TPR) repeat protein
VTAPELGLFALGALLGLSQLVGGVYNETAWGPVALGALGVCLALAVFAPRRPPLALLAPVLGLWLWSLISSSWSDSTDNSLVAADRWLLYAASLAILWWAVNRDRRRAVALLMGSGAGVLGVALWMLVRMLSGHGPALFLGPRLNDPLGYINGQAGYLLVGSWPFLALAERAGAKLSPVLAGVGAFGVVLLTGLGLLAQSRSWEAALAVTLVVLLIAVPGRRRRVLALLLSAAAVAGAFTAIADVWRRPSHLTGLVTVATTHRAAAATLVSAALAGLVWMAATFALSRLAPPGSRAWFETGRVTSLAFGIAAIAAVAVLAANSSSISRQINRQYNAFVHLAPPTGGSRLSSGAGNRYDYWRIALKEFSSQPVRGVGAGNYEPDYYRLRRTTDAIQQPHSLELQTLAELGVVGALLLLAFLGAVAVGFVQTVRRASEDRLARALAVAAGGAFMAWLVQASVDWVQLIPGVTGIALAAAAALYRPRQSTRMPGSVWPRVALIGSVAAVAVVGALAIAPRMFSLDAQDAAQAALAREDSRTAARDATKALQYDSSSVNVLVLRSAAFARLHAFAPALADLERAIALEPQDWVTWALLGDLLTRRGERRAARAAYRHALELNPREPELSSALAGAA